MLSTWLLKRASLDWRRRKRIDIISLESPQKSCRAHHASSFDAELFLVHVTDGSDEAADIEGGFAAWIDPHLRTRCARPHVVASGNAAEEAIRMANEAHADLIVLGSAHKRFADASVIGATTERVVRFAKRAVRGWWLTAA
jgi:nucleotide-binding universal stress UspA family protein